MQEFQYLKPLQDILIGHISHKSSNKRTEC